MTETEFQKRYIAARRAVIAADFSHLNGMQQKAVMTTDGPLLLLAGAGSGKTTVLINRIANLLRYGAGSDSEDIPSSATEADLALLEAVAANPDDPRRETARALAAVDPVEPWRVMAITFTNKAAEELKNRLEAMLGPEANDFWAMTFHSACVRILRRDAEKIGFDRSFTIYDTSDSLSVLKHILKDMNLDDKTFPPRSILSQMGKIRDALLSPEANLIEAAKSGDIRRRKTAEVYAEYARRLKAANAMDFDDLIYHTVRLLLEHEDVRSYYQRRFRYVLIDEYQDTNNLQYLLASNIAGGYVNICVVGDDDQSIYRFRGATIENILSFENQYKHARVIRLEQNYRSTGHILSAANAVIRNNTARKGKELWTQAGEGDKLTMYLAQNENDEAQYVAARILEGYSHGGAWRDHAVLYRMNAQSNQLEYAFKRNGIPYRIIGGTRFFDRAEIKDMLAYLCCILTPNDDLRLQRIINNPPRGIGETSISAVREIALRENKSMMEVVRSADNYPELQRAATKLRLFAVMMEELSALAADAPLDELYDTIIEKTGYIRMLEAKPSDENTARIENVKELKTNILSFMKESGDNTLAGFLDEIALYTDLDTYDKSADCVVMMTMHAAKGLEFPTVFIVGTEEGIFPGLRSIGEQEEMEEERRLCYVALTRARKRLFITCARQRMIFGRTSANKPSRFIDEIPADDIDKPELRRSVESRPSYSQTSGGFASGSYGSFGGTSRSAYTQREIKTESRVRPLSTPAPAKTPAPAFRTGDRVRHKAFGSGEITKMTPMGGDHLIEITFETVGVKRLMLRAAAQHMVKE